MRLARPGRAMEAPETKGRRYLETFDHPDIAVDDVTPYGKVAAVW